MCLMEGAVPRGPQGPGSNFHMREGFEVVRGEYGDLGCAEGWRRERWATRCGDCKVDGSGEQRWLHLEWGVASALVWFARLSSSRRCCSACNSIRICLTSFAATRFLQIDVMATLAAPPSGSRSSKQTKTRLPSRMLRLNAAKTKANRRETMLKQTARSARPRAAIMKGTRSATMTNPIEVPASVIRGVVIEIRLIAPAQKEIRQKIRHLTRLTSV
jgi:hypothetical protein